MVNWKSICAGFAVTLVLMFMGLVFQALYLANLAPVIGGIIAGYIVGGSYRNGILNGWISTGPAGLIYAVTAVVLLGNLVSAKFTAANPCISFETIAVITLVLGFVLSTVLGSIGGIIGITVQNKF